MKEGPTKESLRMTPEERLAKQLPILKKLYPKAETALVHDTPWELLVATILSAQCTDKVTNKVTKELFQRFKTPQDFAKLTPEQLQPHIKSITFFRNKSKNIIACARMIVEKFGGEVPTRMEELLQLPGVARKTANIVLASGFGKAEGIAVDTHVKRVAFRLGLTKNTSPEKIEQDLMRIVPKNEWRAFSYRIIDHGRAICQAKKARCDICPLNKVCPSAFRVSGWNSYKG
ncbi:MAG: endonuclease III [Candidatus Woesearchaeota archaeon]